MSSAQGEERTSAKLKLAVGAIGIVFGDIGTSPLYAFRETFAGPHPLALDDLHIFGVVSLIFWSMTLIVSIQYVAILMSADNKGEGGTLALVALIIAQDRRRASYGWITVLLGVFATALFYGDSMITPAISVLSAVEGLTVVAAAAGAVRGPDRAGAAGRPVRAPAARHRPRSARCSRRSCWSISSRSRCSA